MTSVPHHPSPFAFRWLLACFLFLLQPSPVSAVDLPQGFSSETLVTGINAATSLLVTPDGRVLYAEQTGALRVFKQGRLLAVPALDLSRRLDTYWERGFIGFTLHPDFPRSPYLYVVYVAKDPYTHHVVSRFTFMGDRVDPDSEWILLEGDDQKTLGGNVPAGHQGGPICFGADGMLYIGLGEQTNGKASPKLSTFQGKILRINPDGSIPSDNPFYLKAEGKYRAIWVNGIRNPFGLAVEPGTGRMFESDVGATAFEEVNIITRGGNYGWPHAEGYSDKPEYVSPIYAYPPLFGSSICGAMFYPTDLAGSGALFPELWRGKFFFADWAHHWVKALDPAHPTNVITFAKNLDAPVGVASAPDGSVWVLNRGTIWRDGKKFKRNSGSLVRIQYRLKEGELMPQVIAPPPTLTETSLFESMTPMKLRPNFVEVNINAPPWLPGVRGRRFLSLPKGGRLRINGDGEFEFPSGAVVVQHFDLEHNGSPFETHVYGFTGPRTARVAAYRWNVDDRTARLIEDGEVVPIPGKAGRQWFSPGTEWQINLDRVVSGFLLPISVRQVNRDGQLQDWVKRGWLDIGKRSNELAGFPRLSSLSDGDASPEEKVRSFLDVNCSACHRPGGLSRGLFDARYQTPLGEQGILNGALAAGDLEISGARVVLPGHPERSILHERLKRGDAFRMPPVNLNDDSSPVLPVLEAWIRSM